MSRTSHLSRREFGALAASAAALAPFAFSRELAGAQAITAQDVVDRIKKNIGVEWKAETVDAIKAGDPATGVTGIVTTAMASLDVLQQAVKAGANLVITAEPTFYGRADSRTPPAGRGRGQGGRAGGPPPGPPPSPPPPDPVLAAKNDFIARNDLVVFRLIDHWRLRQPDPFATGLAAALGWTSQPVAGEPSRYDIPAVTLDALASDVKRKLNARGGMRVVGNPESRVRRVALLPGSTPITASLQALPAVDVIIAGEVREWESVEYARDVVDSGQQKGLILVGRIVSEEAGMNACARWLETIVSEVPTRHIPVGDPYWRPA